MRVFTWLLRAAIFFVLFAFALNNEHVVQLNWLFGYGWRGPLVFIVLMSFAAGSVIALLAMLPSWWRMRRRLASFERDVPGLSAGPGGKPGAATAPADAPPTMPPRDGL